jgi:hypothetical protein
MHVCAQTKPSTAEKKTKFEYTHLRAGSVQTPEGWNFADFALSMVNPNSTPIDVLMTLRSDDPLFHFRDGSTGSWHRSFHMPPLTAMTANVFGTRIFALVNLANFPIREKTNFTGSMELSASLPFYAYAGHDFETHPAVDADEVAAYFKSWDPWGNAVPVSWDGDLHLFVVPYTNYWHNEKSFPLGWHTDLTVTNGSKEFATYHVRHKPHYGGEQDPMLGCNVMVPFVEQTESFVLRPGESFHATLEELYGWSNDATAAMEGLLTVQVEPESAVPGTTVDVSVLPNTTGAQSCALTPIFAVIADVPASPLHGTVRVSAEPVPGRGIVTSNVELLIDGEVRAKMIDAPYSAALDTRLLRNGQHVLTVRATALNAEAAISSVTISVSNPP